MERVRATKDRRIQYKTFIRVRPGDLVRVGEEDRDYPGWWWCTGIDARQGWVPSDVLATGVRKGATVRVVADYESTELPLQHGDLLDVEARKDGWLLVRNADDKVGWVPLSDVEPA
jgi:hypothetical protein